MRTLDWPWVVLELTWLMLGADDTACSIGRVICVSISSGATLGQVVLMTTVGIVTLGSKSIGSWNRHIAPRSTSAAMRIVTATGRVTLKPAMFTFWPQAYRSSLFGRLEPGRS